ncbi:MFS general substrate transporter [Rhodocollybia butyracea]|uniref:MFS general substrate transporter n=1 Tax=Rhodocollybia butyracea TaxID=206335 RepID=A0A9P5PFF2_9AGAR|nr:MFS general substrate transporter [Rhodocollybia butyracea]
MKLLITLETRNLVMSTRLPTDSMTVSPQGSSSSILNETTPLLNNVRNDPEDQEPRFKEATPLPILQLLIVCFIRMMDPISFTQIFPYVNEFITFLKLVDNPSQIGFYSGLVESTFAIAQFLAIYQWSKLSNRFGRKPVIMAGTLGVALSTIYFGLSSSLTDMLIARAVGGIFGGTMSAVQSVVGEITDASNQAAAFPVYGLVWPIGGIIGPFIGGVLSNPADKYGSFFQDSIFHKHPYFLPCLVAGTIALCGVVFAYFFLEETLKKKPVDGMVDDREPTLRELLSIPVIRALSISAFALEFNSTAFDVLFVLFCYTPILNGGLGFSPSTIGFVLSSSGLISASLQLFVMPIILKRMEASKLYNLSISAWPVVYTALPILNVISRGDQQETGNLSLVSNIMLWTMLVFVIAIAKVGGVAYSLSLILTRTNTSNPAALSVSNGIMGSAMALGRMISPALAWYAYLFLLPIHLLMVLVLVHQAPVRLVRRISSTRGYLWSLCMLCSSLTALVLGRNISRLSRSSLTHYSRNQ